MIEISSPAEHETRADHALELPTATVDPARDFGGQRFVHHEQAGAAWSPWRLDGFECRDTGIAEATGGLAGVRVVRPTGGAEVGAGGAVHRHDAELLLLYLLDGGLTVRADGRAADRLAVDDCVAIPAGMAHALEDASDDLELLEVALPAAFATTPA